MREWERSPASAITAMELLGWMDEDQAAPDEDAEFWKGLAEQQGGGQPDGSEADRGTG